MPPDSAQRPYHSPLREAQAALTRERILMAAREYLERHEIESLTLRRVAELAGVSPPTVYAHFATMDDLVAAFFQWLKPRLGLDRPPARIADVEAMPARLFPRYDEHGALLRNLMNRPAWDRQRLADRDRRHAPWLAALRAELPHLPPEALRRGGLAVASCWTPTHWRWLRDTGGFPPDAAVAVATWTIRSLIEALRRDSEGLDGAAPTLTSEDQP